MTQFEKKKEEIKSQARQTKFSVWYMDTQQKPEIEKQDQTNGELFTAVETMILKYYSERQLLNGQVITKLMGPWNQETGNTPWALSVEASDFENFPVVSKQYMDMNVYKLSEYVYKNGTTGNGQGGTLSHINSLLQAIDWLKNGKIFNDAGITGSKWQSPPNTQLIYDTNTDTIVIYFPAGSNVEEPLPQGDYYIECNGVEWFGTLTPQMAPTVRAHGERTGEYHWTGKYTKVDKHVEPSNYTSYWTVLHDAVIQNYYKWSNSQRTSNGDWWSSDWDEFKESLQLYYNNIVALISDFQQLPSILDDEINYYKANSTIGGSSETNWTLLGGTQTWDNPGDIAVGWNETNSFKQEVENGGGNGSWSNQLQPYKPDHSESADPKYSDSNLNAVNNIITDKKTKINSRIAQINNSILGVLSPENKDGAFSGLRALRYLWIDARVNKSNGTLVQKKSTYSGIQILTKKANQLNNQLDVLRIPHNVREPRVTEVEASKMEFPDKIVVSWKMVVQATQYSIYKFDGGTDREYNAPDGPQDNLFSLITTIDAKDADGLPVTKYIDDHNLEAGHYYYYKIVVHHDGSGFPPPYDGNGLSTNPEQATSSFLSLNDYQQKVWRAIVNGQTQLLPGFINSGAIRSS